MSKTETTPTAVVLAGKQTSDVLGLLDAKIKSLKHIEETVYKTTGNLEGFPDIKSEMKMENLIRAFGSVLIRKQNYEDATKALGLDTVPQFTVSGGTADQWEHDIKLRIAIITHKETLDTLTSYKAKIANFMTVQEQKELVYSDLATFLAK